MKMSVVSVCSSVFSEDNPPIREEDALTKWVSDPANTAWMESKCVSTCCTCFVFLYILLIMFTVIHQPTKANSSCVNLLGNKLDSDQISATCQHIQRRDKSQVTLHTSLLHSTVWVFFSLK